MTKQDYEYKQKAVAAARDLCYGKVVISKIKEATTAAEIDRIMKDARHGVYEKGDSSNGKNKN